MTQEGRRNCSHPNASRGTERRAAAQHGSCLAIASVLGILATQGTALAEASAQVERAARLVEGEDIAIQGQRIAQNVNSGFAVGDISGPANSPIPVRVQLPDVNDGVYNFLVFQNLPSEFEMSAGFPVEDRWVVPVDEVGDLTVTAPDGFSGSFNLEIKLRIGGTEQSETRTVAVNIAGSGSNERTAQAGATTGSTDGLSPETEAAMIQRAEAMLQTRDVSGARNIYMFMVRKGSGQAAFGLARTYDPAYVEEIGVAGMNAADLEEAKKWYERAALLGHKEAQERLKVLAAGG